MRPGVGGGEEMNWPSDLDAVAMDVASLKDSPLPSFHFQYGSPLTTSIVWVSNTER